MGRYLVTGGSGYIGSHVALHLMDQGHEVHVIDDLSTGHRMCYPVGAKMIMGSVGTTSTLDMAMGTWKYDGVVHLAALSIVGDSMKRPMHYLMNNINNTMILIDRMIAHRIPKMVFSSTAAVYGTSNDVPIGEDSRLDPMNPYGESKLAIERMLRWASDLKGLRYATLRYFNAAGADPLMRSGEMHKPETHLIPLAIAAAHGKNENFKIFGNDYNTVDGTAVRDYVHVSDIASAHVLALEYLDKETSLVANIGTGQGYSVMDVINMIKDVTGKKVKYLMDQRREGDPAILTADPTRLMSLTGWKPVHQLRDIVETANNWYLRTTVGS
jgi:UDP-glucose 4-epimerase